MPRSSSRQVSTDQGFRSEKGSLHRDVQSVDEPSRVAKIGLGGQVDTERLEDVDRHLVDANNLTAHAGASSEIFTSAFLRDAKRTMAERRMHFVLATLSRSSALGESGLDWAGLAERQDEETAMDAFS